MLIVNSGVEIPLRRLYEKALRPTRWAPRAIDGGEG